MHCTYSGPKTTVICCHEIRDEEANAAFLLAFGEHFRYALRLSAVCVDVNSGELFYSLAPPFPFFLLQTPSRRWWR